jgi:hypothetical protein
MAHAEIPWYSIGRVGSYAQCRPELVLLRRVRVLMLYRRMFFGDAAEAQGQLRAPEYLISVALRPPYIDCQGRSKDFRYAVRNLRRHFKKCSQALENLLERPWECESAGSVDGVPVDENAKNAWHDGGNPLVRVLVSGVGLVWPAEQLGVAAGQSGDGAEGLVECLPCLGAGVCDGGRTFGLVAFQQEQRGRGLGFGLRHCWVDYEEIGQGTYFCLSTDAGFIDVGFGGSLLCRMVERLAKASMSPKTETLMPSRWLVLACLLPTGVGYPIER